MTWGYLLPFKADPVRDAFVKDFMSEFSLLDLLPAVESFCKGEKAQVGAHMGADFFPEGGGEYL